MKEKQLSYHKDSNAKMLFHNCKQSQVMIQAPNKAKTDYFEEILKDILFNNSNFFTEDISLKVLFPPLISMCMMSLSLDRRFNQ